MRRSTWILWAILLVVGVFWYLLRSGRVSLPGSLAPTPTPAVEVRQVLFSTEEGSINGIRIQDAAGSLVQTQRGPGGTWSLLEPSIAAADPAMAESAVSQAAALTVLSTVDPQTDLATVGLNLPGYTITFDTTLGPRIFLIGNPTVSGSGYYVQTPDGSLVVVARFGLDALLELLTSPPYLETPTPSPGAAPAATASAAP
jgi:hypothetical protein